MYTLTFVDGLMPRAHQLREGETVIGRAPACDLTITAGLVSRQHARIRFENKRVFVRDAGSTYGTTFKGQKLTGEQELVPGDIFSVGPVAITLTRDVAESDVLSEQHQLFEESATIVKRMDQPEKPPEALEPEQTVSPAKAKGQKTAGQAAGAKPAKTHSSTSTHVERRTGNDRRRGDVGRPSGDRRSGRDRRGGRLLKLLTEIGKTLVTLQPLDQMLTRVVELVFDVLPAERAFLLLRDSIDQPLTARVMRHRDGTVPAKVSISRTIVNTVMHDKVAMLAKDALYDSRLNESDSIQTLNVRSFLCAPLWNRNEVIGVLYCDNPRSKRFTTDDLEVFAALSNYAAVSIEQARLSVRLLEETKRRERLQRYHSPGVVTRIIKGGAADGSFMTQERDVTVMFCDIVGFTTMCQHAEPQEIGEMLNDFFGRMGEVIFEHDGTLDKFIGDAILAVFGAPLDQPDHATRAVSAAIAMRAALARRNQEKPDHPIKMRIAINSGRALTGDIGSPKRREFTVLGDVVNTASRIEGVAQPDQIVISKNTRDRIGHAFDIRSLGGIKLRGRDTDLECFEVIG